MTNLIAFDHALHEAAAQAYEALPPACDRRITNAVTLVMLDAVTQNDAGYNVRSQTGRDIFYDVNGRCNCPDAKNGAPQVDGQPACKHQIAVWLQVKAKQKAQDRAEEEWARRFAERQGMTLEELSNTLMYDLCMGIPKEFADRALTMFNATQRILEAKS